MLVRFLFRPNTAIFEVESLDDVKGWATSVVVYDSDGRVVAEKVIPVDIKEIMTIKEGLDEAKE